MSSSRLFVTENFPGQYYVREKGRTMKPIGSFFDNPDDAFALLRRCEQDEEYLYWQKYYSLGFKPNPYQELRRMRNMSKYEKMVLVHLYAALQTDSNVFTFIGLSDDLNITVRQAKTACRSLKRRGYAEHTAYWDEDGMIAGSGYDISVGGCDIARRLVAEATSQTSDSPAAPVKNLSPAQ